MRAGARRPAPLLIVVLMNTNLTPELIFLPWRADALQQTFSALQHQPWAMLLHSGFAEHAHNRFDILVADPRVTLTTRGRSL